jgi:error-prone DNA polymerase
MLECDGSERFCNNCSHNWPPSRPGNTGRFGAPGAQRFSSIDDLVARTGLRRDELVTLADIGALNAFGYDRRSALWQAEQAVRPSGELFDATITAAHAAFAEDDFSTEFSAGTASAAVDVTSSPEPPAFARDPSERATAGKRATNHDVDITPLRPMTEAERLVADYAGTGLTLGRHPMALRRDELSMRGVLRARDLHTARQGRRVRVAGMVITRQRPGTAKGFVFLTLEDETGIANIIVRPDLFDRDRLVIVEEPFLIVDGVLQSQDGVTSVRAEQVRGLPGAGIDFEAHDFY